MENLPSSKTKKSIFSNFKFRQSHDDKKTSPKSGDFYSISTGTLDQKETKNLDIGYELQKKLTGLDDLINSGTQTSKTIIELAQIESESMSPDSLTQSPKKSSNPPVRKTFHYSDCSTSSCSPRSFISFVKSVPPKSNENISLTLPICQNSLTAKFLDKKYKKPSKSPKINHPNETPIKSSNLKSISCIETIPTSCKSEKDASTVFTSGSCTDSSSPKSQKPKNSFMLPTISSEIKSNQKAVKNASQLMVPLRRGRSASPYANQMTEILTCHKKNIPYIDCTDSNLSSNDDISNRKGVTKIEMPPLKQKTILNEEKLDSLSLHHLCETPTEDSFRFPRYSDSDTNSCDNLMNGPLTKLKSKDWTLSLQGLAEVVDFCRLADTDVIYPHMTTINQRLIELIRSPRSHVCRTACQAAGHLFEFIKDTRRPEFDEIVDLLLSRTADANKFIRQDANLALDCMVTHIGPVHAIRALCSKGPTHKNHLVRTATVRLVVCVVVIAGPDNILNPNFGEHTRKKIIQLLPKFVEDKNVEVRKFAERLYKVFSHEVRFEAYLKKYIEKEDILLMKKNLRTSSWKK